MTTDSRFLITAHDEALVVWDLGTGERVQTIGQGIAGLRVLSVTPDGERVVGCYDGMAASWDLATGERLCGVEVPEQKVAAIDPSATRTASGRWDGTVEVWSLEEERRLHRLTGHRGWVEALAFTPDGALLVSGCDSLSGVDGGKPRPGGGAPGDIRVWDVESGEMVHVIEGHRSVKALAITPDGRWVVSGGGFVDGTVRVSDLATGEEVLVMEGHPEGNQINVLAVTPDGSRVVSGGAFKEHSLRVWDLDTGDLCRTLTGHLSEIQDIVVSPDGSTIVSASGDCTARLWDSATGNEITTLGEHDRPIARVITTPRLSRLLTLAMDGTVRVWDWAIIASGEGEQGRRDIAEPPGTLTAYTPHGEMIAEPRVGAVALATDGRRGFSVTIGGLLTAWDLSSDEPIGTTSNAPELLKGKGGASRQLMAVSDSGDRAVAVVDYDVVVLDVATGRVRVLNDGHSEKVVSLATTGDGRWAVTGSEDTTFVIWDLAEGRLHRRVPDIPMSSSFRTALAYGTYDGPRRAVSAVAVTPDGRCVVTISDTIRFWDSADFGGADEPQPQLSLNCDVPCSTLQVTPDGTTLIIGGTDGSLLVQAIDQSGPTMDLVGHTDRVNDVAVSANGKWLASVSNDASLRLWDLATYCEIARFRTDYPLVACDVSFESEMAMVGDAMGKVHILQVRS